MTLCRANPLLGQRSGEFSRLWPLPHPSHFHFVPPPRPWRRVSVKSASPISPPRKTDDGTDQNRLFRNTASANARVQAPGVLLDLHVAHQRNFASRFPPRQLKAKMLELDSETSESSPERAISPPEIQTKKSCSQSRNLR